MSRHAAFAVLISAVIIPQLFPALAGAKRARKVPEISVTIDQSPLPVVLGKTAELLVTLEPPAGVVLNKYPGIKLVLNSSDQFRTESPEAFVGSREPIENPADFYFESIEPLALRVVPNGEGPEQRFLTGTLTYFYCVKKSGYCAPGRKEIELPLIVVEGSGS